MPRRRRALTFFPVTARVRMASFCASATCGRPPEIRAEPELSHYRARGTRRGAELPTTSGRAREVEHDPVGVRKLAHLGAHEVVQSDPPDEDALEVLDEPRLLDERRRRTEVHAPRVARRSVDVAGRGV